jgi:putative DNA primase/helicase
LFPWRAAPAFINQYTEKLRAWRGLQPICAKALFGQRKMIYQHTERYASENLRALGAKSIARALGGDVVGRDQIAAPGPGHTRKDRSLSVKLSPTAPDGFLVHSHAGDDFASCRDHVKAALGLPPGHSPSQPMPIAPIFTFAPSAGDDPAKIAAAIRVWSEGVDPAGTPVDTYLQSRRVDLDVSGDVLRWHPRMHAMLALFRNIETNEPQAISRTFLDREARKIERKFLGPVGSAAIKLDADEDVLGGLHIGEGVETCMTARQVGLRPSWALGSARAIAAFPVLSGVDCLSLLREHDEANSRASGACAARWAVAGREVYNIQPIGGGDLNDSIRVAS